MAIDSIHGNCGVAQCGRCFAASSAERMDSALHECAHTNERATGEFASAIEAAELRHSTLEPWLDSLASVVGPKRALWADARGCYATGANPGLS